MGGGGLLAGTLTWALQYKEWPTRTRYLLRLHLTAEDRQDSLAGRVGVLLVSSLVVGLAITACSWACVYARLRCL